MERLKQLRKQKGISQNTVATAAGISIAAYSNIENGISKSITIEAGKGIAKALEVPFVELFEIEISDSNTEALNKEIRNLNLTIKDLSDKLNSAKSQIDDKESIINYLKKEKEIYKSSVIISIMSDYDFNSNNLKEQIKTAKTDNEKLILQKKMDHLTRNRDYLIKNFIHIGFFDQKDIDLYYKELKEHYSTLSQNQNRDE